MSLFDGNDVRTRIKFCGMTQVEDVRLAVELGVDAIGIVFAPRSARCVEMAVAQTLARVAASATQVVALVMDQTSAEVAAIVEGLRPDLLQFHGREDDAFCASFGCPFSKALPMREVASADVPALLARYPSAAGFVFDGHASGAMGGSGECFDWGVLATHDITRPWLLAGGLDANNVSRAVRIARPWGVDVSSGIENSPGIKDSAKMRAFVAAARFDDDDLCEGFA